MRLLGRKIEWWHLGLGALGLLVLFPDSDVVESVNDVIVDFTNRGQRLSVSSPPGADGRIPDSPQSLAAQAAVTLGRDVAVDAYALARMLRSEGGRGPVPEKTARAWVALNDRDAHGWTTLYTIVGPKGTFGPQRGWRYASGQDPYENDLYLAEAVLAGQLPDNTGGATKFVDIDSFGVQEGTGSYEALVESWAKDGLQPFEVEGASAPFRVFRRVA